MTQLPTVFILAGGMGTRLGKLSDKVPKSLIEFNGKPFVEYQLKFLEKQGVRKVVLCLGRHGHAVLGWLESSYHGLLSVTCSFDGERLLGTGGALRKAVQNEKGDKFSVMYGDTLLNFNISEALQKFKENECSALMTTYRNNGDLDRSNILYLEDQRIIYDKSNNLHISMDCIDYGFVFFSREHFLSYCKTLVEFDLADFLEAQSAKQMLHGFNVEHRFYEIGSFSGIDDFERWVSHL